MGISENIFMKCIILLINVLVAPALLLGCSKNQNTKLKDPTKAQVISFKSTHSSVSGVTVRVKGSLQGSSEWRLPNGTTEKAVSGDFDFEIYCDHFEPKFVIEYFPKNVSSGRAQVSCEFH